jgi:hypothetical protein
MSFGEAISEKLTAYQLGAYGVFCTGFRAYGLQLTARQNTFTMPFVYRLGSFLTSARIALRSVTSLLS